MLWRHYCPELVEFVNSGMLFKEGQYTVYQMLKSTEIDGIRNITYNNTHRGDLYCTVDHAFVGCNHSIFQIISCFPSLNLMPLNHQYHVLEVLPMVSQLPWQWIPFSRGQCWCLPHRATALLDLVKVNVFEVVSCPCPVDRITLTYLTVCRQCNLSTVEHCIKRGKSTV